MTTQNVDSLGHWTDPGTVTALAAGAVGVTTAGTISGTTAAGAAPTVAVPTGFACNDRRGTFELTPVTGGGLQSAGDVATVRFAAEYPAAPNGVVLTMYDNAATDVVILTCATVVTTAGFNVNVAAALTTAHNYRVSYVVIP